MPASQAMVAAEAAATVASRVVPGTVLVTQDWPASMDRRI